MISYERIDGEIKFGIFIHKKIEYITERKIERKYKIMALRKLNRFTYFDSDYFFEGKRFKIIGKQIWIDYDTKKPVGTKVEVVIVSDKTDYGCEDGEVVSNIYEKLVFKVPMEIDIPMDVEVKPVNAVCTIYGDYRNQLSIVCDDIEIVVK